MLHPLNIDPDRSAIANEIFIRTGAKKEDIVVRAADGAILRGWKIRPSQPNGDWVLVLHGVSDNRTGGLAFAEFLLRHGYSVVVMDSRGHGQSDGAVTTYGWLERHDNVAIIDALESSERVRHLAALGVSMGAAVALQSAAIEPRIEAVVAEDPFADLREVGYDYAGLDIGPLLGKTLFRPATIVGMERMSQVGNFPADDVSPVEAVSSRAFPVILICGTNDHRIPCRHAERIYRSARGPKQLWVVNGAGHASALGLAPAEYEDRVIRFLQSTLGDK